MHLLMIVGTIVWFLAIGLFWYVRPGDVVWFVGSLVLGILYFTCFFWYVTRTK
jgi:hypothetical protein